MISNIGGAGNIHPGGGITDSPSLFHSKFVDAIYSALGNTTGNPGLDAAAKFFNENADTMTPTQISSYLASLIQDVTNIVSAIPQSYPSGTLQANIYDQLKGLLTSSAPANPEESGWANN